MKYLDLKDKKISTIVAGCMRYTELSKNEFDTHIKTALDNGINYFDHADIYADGKAQEVFGDFLKENPSLREKMIIQSKCGITKGIYDFSKEHILNSVKESLKALNTDYLDVLLLHRPDALMEVFEVNEAFNQLKKEGLVKYFGVSNFNSMKVKLLKNGLDEKIRFNQLQFSPAHCTMITHSILTNTPYENARDMDGEILDYSNLNNIRIQAWSPYQYGFMEDTFVDSPKYEKLNEKLEELAKKYEVGKNSIVSAWITRMPQGIQTIAGTTNTDRLLEVIKGADIKLTRKEWYEIYEAAGNKII
ncbi:MAG: aldo/keto reductase [Tissierellia bacterium]|nr:aldo/keto reductase [Tissierellia bacterium]